MNGDGVLHDASDGGVSGHHSDTPPINFLVGPSTASEFNAARLRLIPVACWRVDQIRFAFDSSFVTPDITEELRMLQSLREFHKRTEGRSKVLYPPISVFGHADPVGSDEYNKGLSGRRAAVIYALIIANTAPDRALTVWQHVAQTENWGKDQRAMMQETTGMPDGTSRSELIKAYMKQLAPAGLTAGPEDFLAQGDDPGGKGDYQGCSEFNPLLIFSQEQQADFARGEQNNDQATIDERNAENAPNRRVLILLFRAGSKITPAKWPCPRATEGVSGCHKRFWSDGESRRSRRLPDLERKFDDTADTFACRFYQRITSNSPCEGLFEPVTIRVVDIDYQPMADMPYELTMGEVKVAGKISKDGLIVQKLPPDTTAGTLTCDAFTRDVTFSALDDAGTVTGAQPRLMNLAAGTPDAQAGELDEHTQLAIMRFQNKHEMPTLGQLDDATVSKLKERYGS